MRIVGGEFKGRQFNPGKSFTSRPTTDLAKESLFNILINRFDLESMKVLDLFSGTGSISYEFASRGCRDITAIEQNFKHWSFIRQTIKELNIEGIRVFKGDVFHYLKTCSEQYDLIFADPPFDLPCLSDIPGSVLQEKLLKPDGIFILEHPATYNFSKDEAFEKEKKYGHVHFSFFIKKTTPDNEQQPL